MGRSKPTASTPIIEDTQGASASTSPAVSISTPLPPMFEHITTMTSTESMLWAFLSSLQETITKQGELLRTTMLENVDLKHSMALLEKECKECKSALVEMGALVHKVKDMQCTLENNLQECKRACGDVKELNVQELKDRICKVESGHVANGQVLDVIKTDVNAMRDVCKTTNVSWASMVCNGLASPKAASTMSALIHDKDTKEMDMHEWQERTKRSKNLVIRGMPEKEQETPMSLAGTVEEFLATHFNMTNINVYGAHRVGKPGAPRTRARGIVCTMLDEQKRSIILDNSRVYLKGTPFSVIEDRTPKQQEACRKAYEDRQKSKESKKEATPPLA